MKDILCSKYRSWQLCLIMIGLLAFGKVFGIELSMITDNVIDGESIRLFCYIPNFKYTAEFDIPIYLPYRKVYCNNRDGCTINNHELFKVNSNSSGIILTLKNFGKSIEGTYACIYKEQRATYQLNTSALYVIK